MKTAGRALTALSLVCVGCSDGAGSRAVDSFRSVGRDAGETMLQYDGTPWHAGTPIHLDERVAVGRGGQDSLALYQITDATMLGEMLVVASGGGHEVVAVHRDGTVAWRAGRDGDGPGEFRGELRLSVSGDTLAVYDWLKRRATLYTSDGALLTTLDFIDIDPNPNLVCRIGSMWLFTTRHLALSPGANRDSIVLLARDVSRGGAAKDREIASVHGRGIWLTVGKGPPLVDDQPLTTPPAVSCGDSLIALAAPDSTSVRIMPLSNSPPLQLRWTGPRQPVTSGMRDEWLAYDREVDGSIPGRDAWRADVELPDSLPALAGAVLEGDSAVWLVSYVPPWDQRPTWLRVDLEDGATRHAEPGPGWTLLRARGRNLVVRVVDELGVESVIVLERRGP